MCNGAVINIAEICTVLHSDAHGHMIHTVSTARDFLQTWHGASAWLSSLLDMRFIDHGDDDIKIFVSLELLVCAQ